MTPSYRPAGDFGPRPGPPGASKDSTKSNRPDGPNRDDKNRKRAGERTNEAWQDQQTGFYYAVVDGLLKTGFTEPEIEKIGGGNFWRIFDAATSGH